jgi:type III secretion system YscQ/HrcQ family protein
MKRDALGTTTRIFLFFSDSFRGETLLRKSDAQPDSPAVDVSRAIEALDIEISFEVGRIQVPLAELRTLQAGYIFELESKVAEPVTIRANGQVIGRGQLVQIGDRIGIQTTEMRHHGD